MAIDATGALCAGGSTGGVLCKTPGRVGDSPLVGAGFYASASLGAACATGVGEAIMTHVASYAALNLRFEGVHVDRAADEICARVAEERIDGVPATCGIILIDPDGGVGIAHRCPHMSWAVARGAEPPHAGLTRTLAPAADPRL